jgi:hypothetical protein
VICVFEVFSKEDITYVKEGRKRSDGMIPDPPVIVVIVRDAGVKDKPPERVGSLVHSAKRFDEEWWRATGRDHFDYPLRDPRSNHWAEGQLSIQIALPG